MAGSVKKEFGEILSVLLIHGDKILYSSIELYCNLKLEFRSVSVMDIRCYAVSSSTR